MYCQVFYLRSVHFSSPVFRAKNLSGTFYYFYPLYQAVVEAVEVVEVVSLPYLFQVLACEGKGQ